MFRPQLLSSLRYVRGRGRFIPPKTLQCGGFAAKHVRVRANALTATTSARFSTKPKTTSSGDLGLHAWIRSIDSEFADAWQWWRVLIGCGAILYFTVRVIRDHLPNRTRPKDLERESLELLASHAEVASRLGTPLRRCEDEDIAFVHLKDLGDNLHLRIKFKIAGSDGQATVFAQVVDYMEEGEYEYLVVRFADTGEVLEVYDNRLRPVDPSDDEWN